MRRVFRACLTLLSAHANGPFPLPRPPLPRHHPPLLQDGADPVIKEDSEYPEWLWDVMVRVAGEDRVCRRAARIVLPVLPRHCSLPTVCAPTPSLNCSPIHLLHT